MRPHFLRKRQISKLAGFYRPIVFALVGSGVLASCASAQPESALCADGMCKPAISQTTYFNRTAYRLTDGKTEAVIVPAIGRIMRYAQVGGPNLMWNASSTKAAEKGWSNYGGDKTWLSPQSSWKQFHGKDSWPPDVAFDGKPHEIEVISGGKLRMTTPLSPTGIRISRLMYFNTQGEFVIEQTATKLKGAPIKAGIWSISQTLPADAVFLPLGPRSDYQERYTWLSSVNPELKVAVVKPNLLRIDPRTVGKNSAKIGVDSDVSSLVSVRSGVAWKQVSTKPAGPYPDGIKAGAGFPVELYINADPNAFYQELELLGPLKTFAPGGKSTHTVRWSLHNLSSTNVDAPEVVDEVERLIFPS